MKYWETISDGLRRKGWSVGWFKFTSTIDGREMWSADAANPDGRRLVVQAEDLTVAFLELEGQCCSRECAAARNRILNWTGISRAHLPPQKMPRPNATKRWGGATITTHEIREV